jgi:hypothetical protein
MSDLHTADKVPVPTEDDVTSEAAESVTEEIRTAGPGKRGDVAGLLCAFLVFGGLLNALVGVGYLAGDYAKRAHETDYHDKVLTHVNPEKAKLTAQDRATIANYAMVDANADHYTIPIAHAMSLVASDKALQAAPDALHHVAEPTPETEDESEQ